MRQRQRPSEPEARKVVQKEFELKRNKLNCKKGRHEAATVQEAKRAPNSPRPGMGKASHSPQPSRRAPATISWRKHRQPPGSLKSARQQPTRPVVQGYPERVAPHQHERGRASTASCSSLRNALSSTRDTWQLSFTPGHLCCIGRRAQHTASPAMATA